MLHLFREGGYGAGENLVGEDPDELFCFSNAFFSFFDVFEGFGFVFAGS